METLPGSKPLSFFERGAIARDWHHVHFHGSEEDLAVNICNFLSPALVPEHAAVVIATIEHLSAVRAQARRSGMDLEMAEANGQFVPMDAREFLSRILVDGKPSRTRFRVLVPGLLRVVAREFPHLHVYGELVALLWEEGNADGALRLEQLWNELAEEHSFELLCGYPQRAFASPAHAEHFDLICKAHTRTSGVN